MAAPTRTALVTGANRGIGLEVVRQLASRGVRVFLAARNIDDAEQKAAALRHAGFQVAALELDVADDDSVARAARALDSIDILVNNAGIVHAPGSTSSWSSGVSTSSAEDWRAVLETNFFGAVRTSRAALPGMIARGFGRIVNVSSGAGSFGEGLDGPAPYCASKAALDALTVKLAQEAGDDVKVNAACPGWVRTAMGGHGATRSVEDGADTIVWLATLDDDGPSGGFFRDRKRIPW